MKKRTEHTYNQRRVKIEVVLLLPENINSATLMATFAEALECLPDGNRILIEKLIYDPG